ncbi:MAG: hypothetical protein ACI8PZ_004395 [Myxococcota bacterium]|jgi:hypothetical protein
MRTVVHVSVAPNATNRAFAKALDLPDVRLVGVLASPAQPGTYAAQVACPDPADDVLLGRALDAVAARFGRIHRVVTTIEPLLEPVARQRARLGIAGLSPAAAHRFRDKGAMKDALRAAGVPVAPSRRVRTLNEAREFAVAAGFPLVLKPPAGVSAAATVRVDCAAQLEAVWGGLPRPLLAEGFLTGTEHSLEAFVLNGEVRFHSITRYAATPLAVAENPNLQWVVLLPRDLSAFAGPARVIARALTALGMDDGVAHVEWFWRPDGTVAVGEIGARPPGASFLDLHGHAHDADVRRVWARLVVDSVWEGPLSRRYAVAGVYLRGPGAGRVVAVDGIAEAQAAMGAHVVEARLPKLGQPRASGYEGDGLVIIRHPDDAVVRAAVATLLRTVRVRYAT